MGQAWGRGELLAGFRCGGPKVRDHSRRLEDNIKTNHEEIWYENINCSSVQGQGPVVGS